MRIWVSYKVDNASKKGKKGALHVLVKACTYLKDTDTKNEMCKCFGITNHMCYNILNSIDHNTIAHPIPVCERNKESKFKESAILAFFHLEESSAIDSNCRRIVSVTMNRVEEQYISCI